jgi:hypothetical protein
MRSIMLNRTRIKRKISNVLRNLLASIPAAAIFCLGSAYFRALLWTDSPIDNRTVLLEMLGYESGSFIFLTFGSALILSIVNTTIGDVITLWRLLLGFILGTVLILIASQILTAFLNFSICYGGPKEGCTKVQISVINQIALIASVIWAIMTIAIDRILCHWGWGKLVAST